MAERLQALRGMNDLLLEKSAAWRQLETTLASWVAQYGYQELRTPFLESTSLFKRTIGEVTDIVEKEMYTFSDLNGEQISLRPEGTAGCVRACIEHGLIYNKQQRLWYLGPMFRHEKPQKGRYRQFHQFGVEVFGIAGTAIELELISMCNRLWVLLGVASEISLEINTLGDLQEREAYRKILVTYFKQNLDALDEDSLRRLETNPLRILDSKNSNMQDVIANAPQLVDWVSEDKRQDFEALCDGLTCLGITYKVNPQLVRGLDYYGGTVFEWVTTKLGSQSTVCAGGRYDILVEQLGGKPTPAIGFAFGIERLILLMNTMHAPQELPESPHIYFIATDASSLLRAMQLAEKTRDTNNAWIVMVNTAGGSLKNQFKKADKCGAKVAVIIGSEELLQNTVSVKPLRDNSEQMVIAQDHLIDSLNNILK